jgi:hypothetical protein
MLKKCIILAFAAFLLPLGSAANAATFTAEAKEGSVTIYSSSKEAAFCGPWVKFTYLENGKRVPGMTSCGRRNIKPGEHVKVCAFHHPAIIAPILDGPVLVKCGDELKAEIEKEQEIEKKQ